MLTFQHVRLHFDRWKGDRGNRIEWVWNCLPHRDHVLLLKGAVIQFVTNCPHTESPGRERQKWRASRFRSSKQGRWARSSLLCLKPMAGPVCPGSWLSLRHIAECQEGLSTRKETSDLLNGGWGECGQEPGLTTQTMLPRLQRFGPIQSAGSTLPCWPGSWEGSGKFTGNNPYMSPKLDCPPVSHYQESVCPAVVILWHALLTLRWQAPGLVPSPTQPFCTMPTPSLPVPATSKTWKRMFWPGDQFGDSICWLGAGARETSGGNVGHRDQECSKPLPSSLCRTRKRTPVSRSLSPYALRYCTISLSLIFAYLTTVFN